MKNVLVIPPKMERFVILLVISACAFPPPTVAEDEPIRTDLITKTVLAINASFTRSVAECEDSCRESIVESVSKMSFQDSTLSIDAKNLIKNLKTTFEVDWSPVQTWLERLEKIQKTYFESVLKYRDSDSEPVKEALFYLDIGEIHKATSELLENQKNLMTIVADLSAILEIVQRGRSGLALKLATELGDLTPYHETFGCAHKCSVSKSSCVTGGDGDTDCAAVMRKSFRKSFQNLQKTLQEFFSKEMPESYLMSDDDDDDEFSNEDF